MGSTCFLRGSLSNDSASITDNDAAYGRVWVCTVQRITSLLQSKMHEQGDSRLREKKDTVLIHCAAAAPHVESVEGLQTRARPVIATISLRVCAATSVAGTSLRVIVKVKFGPAGLVDFLAA